MNIKWTILTGIIFVISAFSSAVTTEITRHQTGKDFMQGDLEKVVVDSAGTLRLARQGEELDCGTLLSDAWSIHTLLAGTEDDVYLGTGPNAEVIRWADEKAHLVYPLEQADANEMDPSAIRNEHVFALAQDVAGRLLIGVSGETGKLVRLSQEPETVFEDDRVKYIFAMTLDQANNIYLGTGPEGLIFKLDPFCQNPEVIYDAQDKNILSLAVHNGIVYAGSDQRGVIYKIDTQSKRVAVLYDSGQDEVSALAVDSDGNVYAAATSAKAAMLQLKASEISLNKAPGRADISEGVVSSDNSESLNTANTNDSKDKEEKQSKPQAPTPPPAKVAGYIYRISPDGFVTDVFREIAVLYAMALADEKIYLGTGNKGQLFSVDTQTEDAAILFEDETSTQITSVIQAEGAMYLGLSNPARLMRVDRALAPIGIFESPLIDAGQPARWGKLQVEATLPTDCQVTMVCRSGNIKDPNDSTFSDWSAEKILTEAAELDCPVGRFCQYRLTLTTGSEQATPVVREVAVAHVVPNLAPSVKSVRVQRSRDEKTPAMMNIQFNASDDNKDPLEFTLEFRKAGRSRWILLEEELDKPRFQWDGRTVEDGRYEIRVTASDRKGNSSETALTGSRISDIFVIDNTAPAFTKADVDVQGQDVDVTLVIEDAFSVLGKVRYTVDSNEDWTTLLPDDLVYDTLAETFTFRIDALTPGDHVIAFSAADDLENTRYYTVEVSVP